MLSSELGPMTEGADEVEVLGRESVSRLTSDMYAALKRRPAQEARLAGVLRVLSRYSPRLRAELVSAVDTMVRRSSFQRPLYGALVRALAEQGELRLGPAL